MNEDIKDYKNGLLNYLGLMVCICFCFTTPDGDTLFYKLLKLFGISPGIQIGENSTLYIYMFIPLIVGIVFLKRVFNHWWGYGYRFVSYKWFMRYMPAFIIVAVFSVPLLIEAAYYHTVRSGSGLSTIVVYNLPANSTPVSYSYGDDKIDYSYDITLQNYGNTTQSFKIKQIDVWDFNEVLIRQENSEPAVFSLSPGQRQRLAGEFSVAYETEGTAGSSSYSQPTFVLLNEKEQYQPATLKKLPKYSFW